jgi:excisionase family DNA binding protein
MLTIKEAARRLGVSRSLAYVLIEKGLLSCHRIGTGPRGILRITEAQLEAYLESTRQDAMHRESAAPGGSVRQNEARRP